ncbi:MAG TPA: hypothetical protein VKA54_06650 [Gemmatimonadaceae bacterium]|nr:hypothetical protein [Gemmatimonadaceae bacterium]
MHIRRARVDEREQLLALWERSVRASHRFLRESDVVQLRPFVALELAGSALDVDVNEQNEPARRFYSALGFSVVGRSETDMAGRPFPMLHMRRARPVSLPCFRDGDYATRPMTPSNPTAAATAQTK